MGYDRSYNINVADVETVAGELACKGGLLWAHGVLNFCHAST